MAYRRRQGQGMGRSSTFKEETVEDHQYYHSSSTSSSSLAAQAIMASAAHRDSSHSSAYAHKGAPTYDYTSMGSSNETGSFWGVLARKAKAILDNDNDNNVPFKSEYADPNTIDSKSQFLHSPWDNNNNSIGQAEYCKKVDNPTLRKGIDALTTKMNRIGDTIGNALEEGRTKLLLRELKTVKADLTFAKQRCSQLEEENKILRDARDKGVNPPEDDDMIRVQLETLLEEKARLAHENSVYSRENRFLREIVEYHQLTMQDIVYLDEGIEEVTEVYPILSGKFSVSPTGGSSPTSPASLSRTTSNASRTSSVSISTLNITMNQIQLPPRDRDSNNIIIIPCRTSNTVVDPAASLPTST